MLPIMNDLNKILVVHFNVMMHALVLIGYYISQVAIANQIQVCTLFPAGARTEGIHVGKRQGNPE